MPRTGRKIDSAASKSVSFHEESNTFRTEFDQQTRRPSEAIIAGVAEANNEDPLALPALFDTIDPDALDALFSVNSTEKPSVINSIVFEYEDCQIMVKSHGTVTVSPYDTISQ